MHNLTPENQAQGLEIASKSAKMSCLIKDTLYQIIRATHPNIPNPLEQFSYDEVGNRVTDNTHVNYQYNELNQLIEDDSCKYAYDLDGNMTEKIDKASGDTTIYTYDIENKLVQIQRSGMLAKYSYDALGRRMSKEVNGEVKQFRYDGQDLILEIDANNAVTASYTFGRGIDNPLSMNRNGINYYYVQDGLGSVTVLFDSVGNEKHEYKYEVFGKIIEESGDTIENPFTYTSREYEKESGLLFLRGRYYAVTAGRFINQDPIGFRGGMNLYQYVENVPTMFTDPFGLKWGTESFVGWYYGGGGQAVNLNDPSVGLIGDVMSRVQSSSQYKNVMNSIKQTMGISAMAQCSKGSYSYSESGSREFNVDLERSVTDPLFSLGNTDFSVKYKCSITCDKCGGYKYSCSMDFSLPREKFQDPVDLGNWWPGNQEAGGKPFSIIGGWSENLSGKGK